jgi:chromosome segregation ATPase
MSDSGADLFGLWALGSIAGSLSANETSRATRGFFEHLQHKRELAEADADYGALVAEYNALVDRFWHVHKCAKEWEAEGARRSERIKQLKQELAAANERAETAERLLAETAAREADFRSQAEFYKDCHRRMGAIATQDAQQLAVAKAEIERMEAIIASFTKTGDAAQPTD